MAFARGAIEAVTTPLVIDADALHALAGDLGAPRKRKEPTVLTPHSGEMASILGVDRGEVQNHRLESVRLAAKQSGAVVVLKGDDTLIASANGEIAVSRGNSPALATAGSGDVLGGLVAALLAQGVPAFKAACAAVQIHAQAGRLAAGGATEGVLASDVANALPVARVELGRAA
jgi:NAD(P)H-hydrate epimerase